MAQRIYLAAEVALWLQRSCGDSFEFLGCHNMTGISVPRGDTNPIYCRVSKNLFEVQRTYRGAPGLGSAQIQAYEGILSVLQEMPCAFNLFALHAIGGADDDPTNYDFIYAYEGVEVTSEDMDTQVAGINPDDQSPIMITMPVSFRNRTKVKTLTALQRDLTSLTSNDILSITYCDDAECDSLGNLESVGCQIGFVSSRGPTAVILKTTNGGSTFSSIASPFTSDADDIHFITCDGDIVVALNGEASSYVFSLDVGVTWTEVTTPAKILNRALILTGTIIWFVGEDGYIYRSTNRGSSVELISGGDVTAQTLNDISFSDALLGYIVGNAGAFLYTEDGGSIWATRTGPSVDDLDRVTAIAGTDIVFVGDDNGVVWRSEDRGVTWTSSLDVDAFAGGITGIAACDCNTIAVVGNDLDPYFYASTANGSFYQSIDGGNSWAAVSVPANDGFHDLICCDVNRYWTGADGGYAIVIAGSGLTNI
jgi:photosystem II stability/assembly factor-like uncharacterized protein